MTISICYAFRDHGERISPTHSDGAVYEATILHYKIITYCLLGTNHTLELN